jgi:L-lactate dehydrogenase complex protein LldE
MVTCVVDLVRPEVAEAAIRCLERTGARVDVPSRQTCCGQPAWNAGYTGEARRVARHTLDVFGGDEPVVCLAGSCAAMIKVFYRELFEGRPEAVPAEALAHRTHEFSSFLEGGEVGRCGGTVAYHDSCHMLRELSVKAEPRDVLRQAGTRVVDLGERCCGFGGTFSVKLPEISAAMADEKLAEVRSGGADTVVGCDLSCLLHLEGRARRTGTAGRFLHLAEYLDGGTG